MGGLLIQVLLRSSTGDVILVFGDMDDDGFFFGECMTSGRQGLVPSNFLQEVPSRSPSPYHQPTGNNLARQAPEEVRHSNNTREGGRRPKVAMRADSSTSASSVSGGPMMPHYGPTQPVVSRAFFISVLIEVCALLVMINVNFL